jgi:hypothetical protein
MEMERRHQMAENMEAEGDEGNENVQIRSNFPDQLRRRYEVYLTLPDKDKLIPMRDVTSHHLGSLVKVKVRPTLRKNRNPPLHNRLLVSCN